MSTIERSIDVHVPVRTAYDQWTQFETFPQFMEGVESIQQTDDLHTHWRTNIAGVKREFDAEITEQRPDERVAWKSTSGEKQAGVVTFHRLDDENTRIMLQLDFQPEGAVEKAGDALGVVSHRVKGDLERFKSFIEERGGATGAWRGEKDAPPQKGDLATDHFTPTTPRTEEDPSAIAHGVPGTTNLTREEAQRAHDEGRPATPPVI
ncbi:SRPBCC family protein [Cryptosporangium japonicum]|uniref:SRPBCC family protein n=1 Tax=Cryptosporangium japonicum TaxID=80872 RepID=UPI0031E08C98